MTNANAVILTKRPEIRDVLRQALKAQGVRADAIHAATEDKECVQLLERFEYALLVLDWEFGPDRIQAILANNRRAHRLESHPVFLIAAHDEEAIVEVAREYYIDYVAVGEVTTDTIREQIKGLTRDFINIEPQRKMLLAVDACRKNGDHINAREMLEKMYDRQRDNERVAMELAEAYIQEDSWDKAEDILRLLLSREEVSPRVKHLFARCRLKAGDQNTAIASLKGAQLLSPYNVERLIEMGNLFLKLDRLDDAENAFSEVLEFAPGSKQANFGKSTTKLLMGEVNEALQLLNGIANPRELSAIFNTAAILAIKQHRYEAGFLLYRKALQLLSKKPKLVSRILYNMGIGFVKWGKPEKGLKCFEKSSEQDPDFRDAGFNTKVLKTALSSGSTAGLKNLKDASDLIESVDANDAEMPLIELGLDQVEEEVQLDDVLSDISKVG